MRNLPVCNEFGCTRNFAQRAEVTLVCEVRQGSQPWTKARLDDLSQSGFRIEWLPGAKLGVPLRIRMPGMAMLTANIRWQEGKAIGCEFEGPLHVAVFEHIVRQCTVDGRRLG